MKKPAPLLVTAATVITIMFFVNKATAQGPPRPPAGGHGQSANQQPGNTGGSAPIGSGLGIMLLMGAVWAGYKVRKNKG